MPKLPDISGERMVRVLEKVGFRVVRQRGSHVKLSREHTEPFIPDIVTVPLHRTLRKGTLHDILKVANVTIEELRRLL